MNKQKKFPVEAIDEKWWMKWIWIFFVDIFAENSDGFCFVYEFKLKSKQFLEEEFHLLNVESI